MLPGTGQPAVGDDVDRELVREGSQNLGGVVGGAIVDDDDLLRRPGLREDRLDGVRQVVGVVVGADGDRGRQVAVATRSTGTPATISSSCSPPLGPDLEPARRPTVTAA